ncbi:MAG: hypothetical protein OEL66_08435 [Desulfobulbaceae bacterium]|nr:hypothetical protein [Desulfobulbaceae bacterium]
MEQFISFCEVFGKPLLVLLVLLLVVAFVVVPLLKLLTASPKGKKTARPAAERPMSKEEIDALAEELEASLGGNKPSLSDQEKISRLAKSDPEKAKELVRRWLRE